MLGVPLRALWQIGLWAVVLPALGLATLVLPFSTLLFAHVPATALAFLSFSLLFARHDAGWRRVAAAGAAAGLAAATDLPLAVPAALLGLYAAARAPRIRRLVAFGVGGIVGLIPLFAFNTWAFGNPFHLAYSGVALDPGAGGVEQTAGDHGFFTLHLPDLRVAIELLLSQRGLLVLTPVVVAGAAGVLLLWRRGLRAEAALIAALCIVEVTWTSGHNGMYMSLGGWSRDRAS
jgi:hypothetical protein